MLTLAVFALMVLVALAAIATLIDCWISGAFMFAKLREERAMLDAGFVPIAPAGQTRMRRRLDFSALAVPARAPNRLPSTRALSDGPSADRAFTKRPLAQDSQPGVA